MERGHSNEKQTNQFHWYLEARAFSDEESWRTHWQGREDVPAELSENAQKPSVYGIGLEDWLEKQTTIIHETVVLMETNENRSQPVVILLKTFWQNTGTFSWNTHIWLIAYAPLHLPFGQMRPEEVEIGRHAGL